MNICVYGAASDRIDSIFKEKGEELGKMIAKFGGKVVFGGGNGGMMGAVARGAKSENGEILSITPKFFDVDGALFPDYTEIIYTESMRERKGLLEDKSDAFIITPGGIGTFDELFETLTLRQLCAHEKPIAIYNINGYYDDTVNMLETAIKYKFLGAENRALYFVSGNPQEIMEYIINYDVSKTPKTNFRNAK